MTEPRFRCPQCPTSTDEVDTMFPPNEFTLPEVLEHWRWHTNQATPGQWAAINDPPHEKNWWSVFAGELAVCETSVARGVQDAAHIARMSPSFTHTLIDKWALPAARRHIPDTENEYLEPNGGAWINPCDWCENDWPCADYAAVVAVVEDAGYEQVHDV